MLIDHIEVLTFYPLKYTRFHLVSQNDISIFERYETIAVIFRKPLKNNNLKAKTLIKSE